MSKEEPAMQGSTTDRTSTGYIAIHPLDLEDAAITAAVRAMVSSSKGARPGIDARGQFDALMESVLPRGDVTIRSRHPRRRTGTLGTSSGWAVRRGDSSTCTVVGLAVTATVKGLESSFSVG